MPRSIRGTLLAKFRAAHLKDHSCGCICEGCEKVRLALLKGALGEPQKENPMPVHCAKCGVSHLSTQPCQKATSPVAPPPPVYFANSHAVWDVSKIPAELVYPSPAVPADYHCTFCDGNHFENLCPNRCKPEDAAPPVAPGEQPPRKWICTCAEGKDGRPMLDEDCMVHAPDPAGAYAAPPATKLVDAWWDGAVLNESNYHELVQRINIALATAAKQAREECADKLEKVAAQCEAGGHTSRGKMFRAIATEFRT